MSSSTFSSEARRGTIAALILALAIVVAADRAVPKVVAAYGFNEDLQLFMVQLDRAARPELSAEVIFLGDSSLRSSIDPTLFARTASISALNFGLVSNGAFFSDVGVLEAYLANHPAPKAIVLMHSFGVAQLELNKGLFETYFATPSSAVSAYRAGELSLLEATHGIVAWSSATYRYRAYLKASFAPLYAFDVSRYAEQRRSNEAFRAEREQLGWYPDRTVPTSPPSCPPIPAQFSPTPASERWLSRLLELAKTSPSQVYWLEAPIVEPCAGQISASPYYTEYRAWLADRPGLIVIDEAPRGHPPEAMASLTHARPETAVQITVDVARKLAARLR